MTTPMAGVITRDSDGFPCVGGFRLPAQSANAIMQGDAAAEAEARRAEAERSERAEAMADVAFAHRLGRPGVSVPTLADVLGRELARGKAEQKLHDMGLALGPGGKYVDARTGAPLEEVDTGGVPSAARSLTAERRPEPERDPVAVADELHRDLVRYRAHRNYAAAEAAARAKAGRLCRGATSASLRLAAGTRAPRRCPGFSARLSGRWRQTRSGPPARRIRWHGHRPRCSGRCWAG